MKSVGMIVLFPLLSVIILSLYVVGGVWSVVPLVLVAGSVVGITRLLQKRRPS